MHRWIPNLVLVVLLAACGGEADGNATQTRTVTIGSIQGTGDSSSLADQEVSFTGIVTGDFQSGDVNQRNSVRGFYVQGEADGDPETSDAVFVFDGDDPAVDVAVGERVEVTGKVTEFFGETQVAATRVRVTGSGDVSPTDIEFPVSDVTSNSDGISIADLERYEGMLVRIPTTMFVAGLRQLERYGEVMLHANGRPYQFTNINAPDPTGYAQYRDQLAAASIVLDDGNDQEYSKPVRYLDAGVTDNYTLRVGDSAAGITGNLRYSRSRGGRGLQTWRVLPVVDVEFDNTNPRPAAPPVGGNLRVASFNVLSLFTGIDAGEPACGPIGDANCRGADNTAEFERQLAKIVTAILQMDANIVGLAELENNADASLIALVDALNDVAGDGSYAYIDTGTIGTDAIKVGFIYTPATVTPKNDFAILDSSVTSEFNDDKNRPVLAQTFESVANAAVITVLAAHLKSRGSDCDELGDPNRDDGQGNCSLTRTRAAAAVAEWIASDPTDSGDPDFLFIGDLNAYVAEDPLTALKSAGLINLAEAAAGAAAYSFVFDSQSGALDHALATPGLVPQVVQTIEWHINADEPRLLDYNLDNDRDPALFDAASPFRASDHDPVIVDLDLR